MTIFHKIWKLRIRITKKFEEGVSIIVNTREKKCNILEGEKTWRLACRLTSVVGHTSRMFNWNSEFLRLSGENVILCCGIMREWSSDSKIRVERIRNMGGNNSVLSLRWRKKEWSQNPSFLSLSLSLTMRTR